MKKELKKYEIYASHIREGDIILTTDKTVFYIITRIGHTFFRRHKYFEIVYFDGRTHIWFMDELGLDKKTIYRLEEIKND